MIGANLVKVQPSFVMNSRQTDAETHAIYQGAPQ